MSIIISEACTCKACGALGEQHVGGGGCNYPVTIDLCHEFDGFAFVDPNVINICDACGYVAVDLSDGPHKSIIAATVRSEPFQQLVGLGRASEYHRMSMIVEASGHPFRAAVLLMRGVWWDEQWHGGYLTPSDMSDAEKRALEQERRDRAAPTFRRTNEVRRLAVPLVRRAIHEGFYRIDRVGLIRASLVLVDLLRRIGAFDEADLALTDAEALLSNAGELGQMYLALVAQQRRLIAARDDGLRGLGEPEGGWPFPASEPAEIAARETCDTCKFWHRLPEVDGSTGKCQRYVAPEHAPAQNGGKAIGTVTYTWVWCKEYRRLS